MTDAYERMRAKLETEASEWKARFEAEAEAHSETRRQWEDAKRREAEARAEVVKWRGQYECAATECEGALGALSDCRRREAERTAERDEARRALLNLSIHVLDACGYDDTTPEDAVERCARERDTIVDAHNDRIAAARAEGARAMQDAAHARMRDLRVDGFCVGEAAQRRLAALSPATVVAGLGPSPAPPPEAMPADTWETCDENERCALQMVRPGRLQCSRFPCPHNEGTVPARSAAPDAPPSPPEPSLFNLAAFFDAKAQWSRDTFGPHDRYEGVTRHIERELQEVRANPADLVEWVDVALLAMDGAWRSAKADGRAFVAAMVAKDAKNRTREWPDWRTLAPGDVSEHRRSLALAAPTQPAPSDACAVGHDWDEHSPTCRRCGATHVGRALVALSDATPGGLFDAEAFIADSSGLPAAAAEPSEEEPRIGDTWAHPLHGELVVGEVRRDWHGTSFRLGPNATWLHLGNVIGWRLVRRASEGASDE